MDNYKAFTKDGYEDCAAAKSLQSCPTLCDPIDRSPLAPRPWDSPGKNTGVGCHFLLQCMKVKRESDVAQSCPTLSDPMDCSPPGSSIHGIFQAAAPKNARVGLTLNQKMKCTSYGYNYKNAYAQGREKGMQRKRK